MTNELYHYGRLGMKYGQHVYGKNEKAAKTERKQEKMKQKMAKYDVKKEAAEKYFNEKYKEQFGTDYLKDISTNKKELTHYQDIANTIRKTKNIKLTNLKVDTSFGLRYGDNVYR